jgi:hypothetical protein
MARGLTAVDEASATAAAQSQAFRAVDWPIPKVVEGPGLHVAAREPVLPKAGRWGG